MRRILLVFAVLCCGYAVYAQKPMSIKMKDPIVCYAKDEDHAHYIAPPKEYLNLANSRAARTNATKIEVEYLGFDGVPEAKAAFDRAVQIWESVLNTPVTIRIQARWVSLAPGVLGSAIYTSAYANFEGAQKLNVFYPVALAEKITGREMNDGEPDLVANFNRDFNWNYDPNNPNIPSGQYDLTTVVLHEIGHGLGFAGTFSYSNAIGQFGLQGTGVPIIYDVPVENVSGDNFIQSIQSPSAAFGSGMTSDGVFFDAASGRTKLYAPVVYNGGSSISHVDESTYNGTPNALMTPQIAAREQLNHPGIALEMLGDLGWEIIKIKHNRLPGTEDINGPYTVTAKIEADSGYNASSVKLNWTINGTTFQVVNMTPAGPAHTFSGTIVPPSAIARDYGYFISVENEEAVEYVNPGKIVRTMNTQSQQIYVFTTGPDTKAPKIVHEKKPFLLEEEEAIELTINAEVSDNTGSADVVLEYLINNDPHEAMMTLTSPESDSIYTVTINLGILENGDQVKYRIVATDHASSPNTGYSPSQNEYHILNVVGLGETRDFYSNDFESTDDDGDLFGTGFSIRTVANFTGRGLHSEHPYAHGAGFPGNERNLIYQLRYPIRVRATDATIKFDEIALVEPNDAGSVFGGSGFYDYVIVEGSTDGGETWEILLPGYNVRAHTDWLAFYNTAVDANGNSSAVGTPNLYKPRVIDLLQTYSPGEEVVIRFRMYIDEIAGGWGWAVDNLKIQVDDVAPLILHDHKDYLVQGATVLPVPTVITDSGLLDAIKFEIKFNNGTVHETDIEVSEPEELVDVTLNIQQEGGAAFPLGTIIEYRIVATDTSGNTSTFPTSGFIKVPVLNFGSAVNEYHNNFNAATTDFVGNFFSISTPDGFSDGAIHSDHMYSVGLGLAQTSDFSYTLTKPITISASNPYIRFDEIVIVEGQGASVAFGSPGFNDYVVVEGSNDGGATWTEFEDGYDATGTSVWVTAFANKTNGTPSLFRSRTINMTESGTFDAGDDVLIRFRLFSDQSITGWGWAIDNLFIQNPVTGVEGLLETSVSVYPNPVTEKIIVEADVQTATELSVELLNMQGQKLYQATSQVKNGKAAHTIAADQLSSGMYLVRITSGTKSVVRKVVKRG